MNIVGVVNLLGGGGDIPTLHVVIELIQNFCTQKWWGLKTLVFTCPHTLLPSHPSCPLCPCALPFYPPVLAPLCPPALTYLPSRPHILVSPLPPVPLRPTSHLVKLSPSDIYLLDLNCFASHFRN